jgi:hypothetical protein
VFISLLLALSLYQHSLKIFHCLQVNKCSHHSLNINQKLTR